MSCDEKVVKLLGEESKKIYSYTLLEEASGGEWKRLSLIHISNFLPEECPQKIGCSFCAEDYDYVEDVDTVEPVSYTHLGRQLCADLFCGR